MSTPNKSWVRGSPHYAGAVTRMYDLDDLVDANGVAEILGLSRTSGVFVYQTRYLDMPKPVLDLGEKRVKLWSRRAMKAWQAKRRSAAT